MVDADEIVEDAGKDDTLREDDKEAAIGNSNNGGN